MMMTEDQRKLAEDNLKLVHYIANKRVHPAPWEYEDCVSEGYLGLCMACMRFNPNKGFSFATFASQYIEGFMRTFRRKNTLLSEPRKFKDNYYRITLYKETHGDDCDVDEMCKALKISHKDYMEMIASREIIELDRLVEGKDDSSTSLSELIPDRGYEERVKMEQEEELLIQLEEKLVSRQSPRIRDVYDDYFYSHLFGDKINQSALAKKYHLSQSYVSRIVSSLNRELISEYKKYM